MELAEVADSTTGGGGGRGRRVGGGARLMVRVHEGRGAG